MEIYAKMKSDLSHLVLNLQPEDLKKIKESRGVMVACSGGVDSAVMLRNFWQISKNEHFFTVAAFHLNYRLRGIESDKDENFVKSICDDLKIQLFTEYGLKTDELSGGESTQEWARRIRFEHLDKFAEKGWIIALGHHANDLAENVIFRLARGSRPENLLGMQRWNENYFRPLLELEKETIVRFAKSNNIPFREDRTNKELDYSRNRIRNIVIRELENISPGAVRKIIETANYAHSYANTARILLKNQNQPPKNLYEFMLLCESLSDDKILLKKSEWKEIFRWYSETSSDSRRVSSVGTFFKQNNLPHFRKVTPQKTDYSFIENLQTLKKLILIPGSVILLEDLIYPGSKLKITQKTDHSKFTATPIDIFTFEQRKNILSGSNLKKFDKLSHDTLKLGKVDKSLTVFIAINNNVCAIFNHLGLASISNESVIDTQNVVYHDTIEISYA